jgi:hypothetical protein
MDGHLSRDPVLAALTDLFPVSALPGELAEFPPPPPVRRRRRRPSLRAPECLAVMAATILVVCAVLGLVFDNGVIALSGLAATLLLGAGCSVALKRRHPAAPVGGEARR